MKYYANKTLARIGISIKIKHVDDYKGLDIRKGHIKGVLSIGVDFVKINDKGKPNWIYHPLSVYYTPEEILKYGLPTSKTFIKLLKVGYNEIIVTDATVGISYTDYCKKVNKAIKKMQK